jgi:DNA-binding response OmpR family regulator
MPSGPGILLVDDEENIRVTLSQLLQTQGFNVTTAGTVAEALTLISQSPFDVLIADLNLGHPSDGFIVVSAMRRLHPDCLTFILTGYPDFESALEAIRQHVNDYLVKPTPIEELIGKINAALVNRQTHLQSGKVKRVSDVIEENKEFVIDEWIKSVKRHTELMRVRLSDADRKDHVPELLDEAVERARGHTVEGGRCAAAEQHGIARYKQGYTVPMLVLEARLLQDEIAECVRRNLLAVDMSHLISDLTGTWGTIASELQESTRAFMSKQAGQTVQTASKRSKT